MICYFPEVKNHIDQTDTLKGYQSPEENLVLFLLMIVVEKDQKVQIEITENYIMKVFILLRFQNHKLKNIQIDQEKIVIGNITNLEKDLGLDTSQEKN